MLAGLAALAAMDASTAAIAPLAVAQAGRFAVRAALIPSGRGTEKPIRTFRATRNWIAADAIVPLTRSRNRPSPWTRAPLSHLHRARPNPPPRHSVQRQHFRNHVNVHPASSASTYAQISSLEASYVGRGHAHRGHCPSRIHPQSSRTTSTAKATSLVVLLHMLNAHAYPGNDRYAGLHARPQLDFLVHALGLTPIAGGAVFIRTSALLKFQSATQLAAPRLHAQLFTYPLRMHSHTYTHNAVLACWRCALTRP
ncbi:hypothetical protein C8J57DRAFT_1638768 [Mycena rebaudengoi]|nr:hypothetical protein C8J57DRAFT_1638768 [Mycena rebaudengoi]